MIGSTSFSTLWNTADTALPQDLKVQRINLAPLFVNLQLSESQSTVDGQYLIDGQPSGTPMGVGGGINSYFFQNTMLTLINPSSSPTVTNAELLLSRSLSFFFVQNFWRSVPFAPAPILASQTNAAAGNLADAIAIASSMFASSPNNTNAANGATPSQVLNLMSNFMASYPPYADWVVSNNANVWAAPSPTDTVNYGYYVAASNYQSRLAAAMKYLANPSGGSGNVIEGGCTNAPTPSP
jgi:hypothetical protein